MSYALIVYEIRGLKSSKEKVKRAIAQSRVFESLTRFADLRQDQMEELKRAF